MRNKAVALFGLPTHQKATGLPVDEWKNKPTGFLCGVPPRGSLHRNKWCRGLARGAPLIFLSAAIIVIFSHGELKAQQESERKKGKECKACERAKRTKRVLGDITDIDLDNNQLTLVYIDYETDKKKDIIIYAGENTKFKQVNFLKDLKVGDSAEIRYIIDPGGRPIALRISLKLPESEE